MAEGSNSWNSLVGATGSGDQVTDQKRNGFVFGDTWRRYLVQTLDRMRVWHPLQGSLICPPLGVLKNETVSFLGEVVSFAAATGDRVPGKNETVSF